MRIDVIEPLELPATVLEKFGNAIGRLHRLAVGLGYLYGNVRKSELAVDARILAECGNVHAQFIGNHPILNDTPMPLIEFAFHWYAVSLVNFVRATSAMAYADDKKARNAYQEKVLGNVAPFRDKIAAHFAGMTANKNDNDAERVASLIPIVSWAGERFGVEWVVQLGIGGVESDSKAIGPWSLTETHEDLCKRFPILRELTPALICESS